MEVAVICHLVPTVGYFFDYFLVPLRNPARNEKRRRNIVTVEKISNSLSADLTTKFPDRNRTRVIGQFWISQKRCRRAIDIEDQRNYALIVIVPD